MRTTIVSALLFLSACTSSGPQGPEGPQGPAGPSGPSGPAGAAGAKGDKGDKGDTGAMGAAGAMGAQGPQGPQGLQGPQGAVLVVDGGVVVGPAGSSVIVTPVTPGGQPCPEGGIRVTQLSDGGISHVCNGATGATGATGPQGAQGLPGVAGSSVTATVLPTMSAQCMTGGVLVNFPDGGATAICNGAQGPQGQQGATGAQGPQGATGSQGPQGLQGPTGATGAQGPQGATGSQGPQGLVGPAGPPGAVLYLDGGVVFSAASQRPQVVGFTAFTSNGNAGGRTQINNRCATEFAGSHVCTSAEFRWARSAMAIPGSGAWLDYGDGSDPKNPYDSGYCGNWTYNGTGSTAVGVASTGYTFSPACNLVLPFACCVQSTPSNFRGYTVFTTNGNAGGRQQINARCSAEFPGSHVCTSAEFRYARPSTLLGAQAAWLDYGDGSNPANPYDSGYCGNWTYSGTGSTAVGILPTGYTNSPACNSVLPFACCD